MKPRLRRFFFLLPWLIIVLVPSLRLAAREQMYGSEYIYSQNGQAPVWLARLSWATLTRQRDVSALLPPTTHLLAAPGEPNSLPIEVLLKAPEVQDQIAVHPVKVAWLLDQELKKRPRDPWLLATRLRASLGQIPQRGVFTPPPFHWSRADDGSYLNREIFPLAGRAGEEEPLYIAIPWNLKPALVPQAIKDDALSLARRGRVAEPDNAFWPWQIAYLLLLDEREEEARREILAASQLPRFDEHRRHEIRAALFTARADRALTWDESLAVAQRQDVNDPAWPQREFAFLWLARRREKEGDLSLTAAITRVAARMREGAIFLRHKRQAVLLQSAAWMGQSRSVYWAPLKWAPSKQLVTPELLPSAVGYSNIAPLFQSLTPRHFATRFAGEARRRGQVALANESLRLGQEASSDFSLNSGWREDKERFGIQPGFIARAAGFTEASELVLWQLQLALMLWLLLCFALWPRLSKPRTFLERAWRIVTVLCRSQEATGPKPMLLRPAGRDVSVVLWFCSALVMISSLGAPFGFRTVDWFHDISNWYPNSWDMSLAVLAGTFFILAPLVGSTVWCLCGAVWRYKNQDDARPARPEPEHMPPSVKPLVVTFIVWSITAGVLLIWLAWLIPMQFGPNSLSFMIPSSWTRLIGQNYLDFALTRDGYWVPLIATLVVLAMWLLKWMWQMPAHYRGAAFGFFLHWQRAVLGAWLIIGSWLYLIFLVVALAPGHNINAQLTTLMASPTLK